MLQIGRNEINFPETPAEAAEWKAFTTHHALASRVLAVATTRVEGTWCAYSDAVEGMNHDDEMHEVLLHGCKLLERVARMLFPYFEGVPYAG